MVATPSFSTIIAIFGVAAALIGVLWALHVRRKWQDQLRELQQEAAQFRLEVLDATTDAQAAETFQPHTDELPEPLIDACARGACALFTGGGIGALAGLPSWGEVLATLIVRWASEFSPDRVQGMRGFIERGEYDTVAELLESRLGHVGLMLELGRELVQSDGPPQALQELVNAIPFPAFLTTNYDDLLEEAVAGREPLVLTPRSNYDFAALLRETNPYILKLHGEIVAPEAATSTMSGLRAVLDDVAGLRSTLRALFDTRMLLFVGVGMQTIESLCDAIGFRGGSQRHYALVLDELDVDLREERFLSRYNIELVRIESLEGVGRSLSELATRAKAARLAQLPDQDRAGPSTLAPARVVRLALKKIGPFEDALFEFHKPWTVLLGNNGAGKSTVLRALAFALSGTDSEAQGAGRTLLRRGEISGSIELTLATGTIEVVYRTQLSLEQGRLVVKASTAPLQAGTLVAFGFPAIRGVPPAAGFDPTSEESYAFSRVADVLPLIRGGVDDRATNLRRWIFNSYVRSLDESLPRSVRARYRKMIDSFFALVDAMTPGFDLRFSRCDTETFEILLATSDGEIPLDYVSQGMNSTIGWAGILIQRLSEIHADWDDPQTRQALLLIDEIDSHLHPEWQMNLVPSLKAHFPGVQVIATTHSPLMVGNLEEHEVIRVGRDKTGMTVEHLSQSFKGYRADQVLTDAPFEMDSTRAKSWEDMRDEYARLNGRSRRTPEEEERLTWLTETLRQAPAPFESRTDRIQAEVVEAALREAIEAVTNDAELVRKLKRETGGSTAEGAVE